MSLPDLAPTPELTGRKAAMRDVPAMLALIEHHARRGAMLRKNRETLYATIRDYGVLETPDGAIAACVGLHVLWHDLAEVRSLAVRPDYQGRGLGRRLVMGLEREARELGITRLFAWTSEPGFFERCGYRPLELDELPPKVWKEYHKAAMLKAI